MLPGTHYQNTSHVFPEPLCTKVIRIVPICDGSTNTNECSMMKIQLYGFSYLTRKWSSFTYPKNRKKPNQSKKFSQKLLVLFYLGSRLCKNTKKMYSLIKIHLLGEIHYRVTTKMWWNNFFLILRAINAIEI